MGVSVVRGGCLSPTDSAEGREGECPPGALQCFGGLARRAVLSCSRWAAPSPDLDRSGTWF